MPPKHSLSISLTEHLASFIKMEVASGRYSTASEVVRAGLRLLQEGAPGGTASDSSGDTSTLSSEDRARVGDHAALAGKS
ncbi:type II toxin-antitoxin system ParD family antitoxin [Paraburkholderia sp. UYCP14C]|uniref:type II toxin-antitoxin system ParD family antitoxin n=1 Tax=Paraburkholderia sp. UYCP14C TaxID=2511130 RepID=UPI0010204F1F|nr:type II toxin-antitoxin system ParD family antitoxin [Paraburkholderia sp. UYCP14C]RZF31205.1 type II toxin-antitoxin system ParD family antitoxin [Paraburkholderia sp. UYCP14C]